MYEVLRPWLFRLDPERAHALGFIAARVAQTTARRAVRERYASDHAVLRQQLLGIDFKNPVGLAAGFDKNARLLPFWQMLGFGFVEVGSVTARRSRGSSRPRAFRLPADEAIINRMGLPNQGAVRIAHRIRGIRMACQIPLGISIAKTPGSNLTGPEAVEDYRKSFSLLAPLADYVALNISCPNTADGRTFEDPRGLDDLLTAISYGQSDVPVVLKLSPPVSARVAFDSQVEEILAVGRAHGVSGYIASNTATGGRGGLRTDPAVLAGIGSGGLSGPPLRARTLQLVRYLFQRLGPGVPIIGVGGIDTADAACDMLRAGASLVQLYTGLAYKGPELVRYIKEGLARRCEQDGLASVSDAIGMDAQADDRLSETGCWTVVYARHAGGSRTGQASLAQ